MIVYLARAIQAFVMYCVNGTSRSSLLIESTDSMIQGVKPVVGTKLLTPAKLIFTTPAVLVCSNKRKSKKGSVAQLQNLETSQMTIYHVPRHLRDVDGCKSTGKVTSFRSVSLRTLFLMQLKTCLTENGEHQGWK